MQQHNEPKHTIHTGPGASWPLQEIQAPESDPKENLEYLDTEGVPHITNTFC